MGFADGFFGTGPDDPRYAGSMAMLSSIMQGKGFGGGTAAYAQAMTQARDQADTRKLRELQMKAAEQGISKGGVELEQLRQAVERNNRIRNRLTADNGTGQPTVGAQSAESPAASGTGLEEPPGTPRSASTSGLPTGARGQLASKFIRDANVYFQEGDPEAGNKLLEHAVKFLPEVHKIEVAMQNGQPVNVITYKTGEQEVSRFGATPKVHWADTGNAITPVDEHTMQPLGSMRKTQTPDSVASLAQSERHFQTNQNAPQYMETNEGLVALPKRVAPGQAPVGTPVQGANGEPLGKPLRPIPPAVNGAIIQNSQSLKQIDRALTLLEGKDIGNPDAGGQRGDVNATGFKGFLPQTVLNRVDPKGVDARAEVADIGSLKIHDRSGAAVTISEAPRLMPFIPQATDNAATVQKKLRRLRTEIANEANALQSTYSREQGYQPSPVKAGGSGVTVSNW